MKNLIETAKTIPTIRAEEASEDLSEKGLSKTVAESISSRILDFIGSKDDVKYALKVFLKSALKRVKTDFGQPDRMLKQDLLNIELKSKSLTDAEKKLVVVLTAFNDRLEKSQETSEAVVGLDHKSRARNHAMFKWEDINKALMHVGMAPPNILKVSSALRGKEQ
tara:strand:+ start:3967 stop:4461 length:495 start_codon:yes stop_codon:yes gene_type:complete